MNRKKLGKFQESELPHNYIGKLFLDALNSFDKNKKAVIDVQTSEFYTYEQLLKFSQNLASNLRNFEIKKDDVIGIVSENSRHVYVGLLASFYLAAPIHFMNPGYTEYELKEILNLSKPKLVFCSKKAHKNVTRAKSDLSFIKTIILLDGDGSKDELLFKNLIQTSKGSFRMEETIDLANQVAVICNSSGTTGLPKGVMISQENCRTLLSYGGDSDLFHMEPVETVPVMIPFFHIYGFFVMISSLYWGCTVIIFDQFNANVFLKTVQSNKVKQLCLVPSLIRFLISNPLVDRYDLSSVKHIYTGGSPLSDEDKKMLYNRLKIETIRQAYGCTEIIGLAVMTPRDGQTPKGSAGKLIRGRELKIVDPETQKKLGVNQQGEICIKGGVMIGYINDVEKSKEVVDSDGFLHTGDLGYCDNEGYIYIVGRIKEMIKYNSFQVSPVELENILMTHPAIEDVAIVGKPDQRTGEVAMGFVVKKQGVKLTEDEVFEYLSRFVCSDKWLYGGVKFLDNIPRNAAGKILRKQLQQLML